ncbi:MAG: hypothetical protein HY579_12160, partial [Nitrospinae bacterium]|nr:hypothetical protein [Nitrospinota bacterium]
MRRNAQNLEDLCRPRREIGNRKYLRHVWIESGEIGEGGGGGLELRRSYTRSAKRSLAMQGRYAYARQMRRARKEIRKPRMYLGRVTRDIGRKSSGNEAGAERRAGFEAKELFVDRGYRGHDCEGNVLALVARQGMSKVKGSLRKWL